MTKLATFIAVAALTLVSLAAPARAEWGRTYVFGTGPTAPPTPPPLEPLPKATAPASSVGDVPLNTSGTWWFSPSVGFDIFSYDVKTHAYSLGIIPGVGYGLKYCPAGWTATSAVFAVDLFVQAGLLDESATVPGGNYFAIQAIPIVTFLDWFSVGFGPDELIGLSTAPSELHWLFSFGLRKST
jgi:hypothetical protein